MIPVLERHPVQISYTAGGAINLELSPKPYTLTRLALICRPSITTTTATWLNDPYDRIISSLTLNGGGKTVFDFRNMRAAYWHSRFALPHLRNYKRPTVVADSATTLVTQFAYIFHFGVQPRLPNGDDNPWDLSAGIPPTGSGNLTLQGAFAANTACGTNVTVADCDIDVYCYGVRQDSTVGESAASIMPRAIPQWTHDIPTPTATSSAFATTYNVPSGNYLHSSMVMQLNGTGLPRDDSVLNSFKVNFALEARDILSYGGQTGAILDYKAAEILSQLDVAGAPEGDDVSTAMTAHTGTVGVPNINHMANSGLIYLPFYRYLKTTAVSPYGANLSNINTGDIKFMYGVSDAAGVEMHVTHRKYVPFA